MAEQFELVKALLSLKNPEEMNLFLKDLCTPAELRALEERLNVVFLLFEGKLSYREIRQQTGASLTTITRVARFLKDEPYGGYRLLLERMKKKGE